MTDPEGKILLKGSALTNVGRVRNHNEDNIHLWTSNNDDMLLAIVADGMGGAAAGEEASRIAVETIMSQLADDDPPANLQSILEEQLSSAVQAANLSIMQEAVDHPRQRGMGTTVTMVLVREQTALFAHVGDSRAYRVDPNGHIEQITSDHSFVQALLDAGHITEEQAETHPMSNVLYRALGQTHDLDVDTYRAKLFPGDRLVLCSDGLTRHVRTGEIGDIAGKLSDSSSIAQQLIDLANERGGEDNISVIVITLHGDESLEKPPVIEDVQFDEPAPDDDDTLILKPQTNRPKQDLRRESSDVDRPENPNPSQSIHLSQTGHSTPIDAEGQDRTPPK